MTGGVNVSHVSRGAVYVCICLILQQIWNASAISIGRTNAVRHAASPFAPICTEWCTSVSKHRRSSAIGTSHGLEALYSSSGHNPMMMRMGVKNMMGKITGNGKASGSFPTQKQPHIKAKHNKLKNGFLFLRRSKPNKIEHNGVTSSYLKSLDSISGKYYFSLISSSNSTKLETVKIVQEAVQNVTAKAKRLKRKVISNELR